MTEWWSAQQAGIIGAIGGSAVGIVGALIGSMSFLVARGKAKPLFLSVFGVMIAVGVIALCVGVVALIQRQPYHVWYPLGLGGLVCSVIFGGLLPVIMMRYKAAESRRFEAEQLRRAG